MAWFTPVGPLLGNVSFYRIEFGNGVHNQGQASIDPPGKIRLETWIQADLDRRAVHLDRSHDFSVEYVGLRRIFWIERPFTPLFQVDGQRAEHVMLDDARGAKIGRASCRESV